MQKSIRINFFYIRFHFLDWYFLPIWFQNPYFLGWILESNENHRLMQSTFMHLPRVHYLRMDSMDYVIQLRVRAIYSLTCTDSLPLNIISRYVSKYAIYVTIFNIDSAFKKIKILQEASLEHHPTTVSCPTPARRRHRTTFTQVCDLKPQLLSLFVFKKDILHYLLY